MANYYVRLSGNDSNNGTSAATAWRTIGKALGSSGISSGDQCFIGAGTYREVVSVAMTSATAETKIIGDVTGAYTGDAGEVIWSSYLNGDGAAPSTSAGCLDLNTRNYLTVENITFIAADRSGLGSGAIGSNATASNITIRNCTMLHTRHGVSDGTLIYAAANVGVSLNWLIESCRFYSMGYPIAIQPVTSATGADWDLAVTIRNCWFLTPNFSGTHAITVAPVGTNTYRGNGVAVINCSGIGPGLLGTNAASSTTYPATAKNNTFICTHRAGFNAQASGQITDLGGNRFIVGNTTGSVNTTLHATTRVASWPNLFPLELGQSAVLGQAYRHPLMPYAASGTFPGGSLGFGNVSGGTSTSITGRARPSGSGIVLHTGTVTSATSSTLTDSNASFPINGLTGALVRVNGLVKRIGASTKTQLTISGAAPSGGLWSTTPSNGDAYIVYQGPQVETGKATAGAATTLTDSGANWATGQWSGYSCEITGGTSSGSVSTVTSSTSTAVTVASWANGTPDNTSTYALYWPGGSLTATQASAGAFELGDTARAETTTTDSGTGARIDGPGSQDLTVPVDATSTTISVRARYDSNHGTGSKPQLAILAQPELSVSAETVTMTSAADTWETLSLTAFTPTAAGVVTIRLVSNSATPYGVAYFDTITVS